MYRIMQCFQRAPVNVDNDMSKMYLTYYFLYCEVSLSFFFPPKVIQQEISEKLSDHTQTELVTRSDQEKQSNTERYIVLLHYRFVLGSHVKRTNSLWSKELYILSESTKNAAKSYVLVKVWCFFHLKSFKHVHNFLFREI